MGKNNNPEKDTITNRSWEKLFEKYNILEQVNKYGFFEIEAKQIKEIREPRLMAKFDHKRNLPFIFKINELSILPISRSKYVIGRFDTYQSVNYDSKVLPQIVDVPTHLTTIDPFNLYSESSALHCATVSGMIDNILGEEAEQTVSGRMSSKEFDFHIRTNNGIDKFININNSQVEIDGGYESDSFFMIVEAKKETVADFMIRQLYYPYRLWENQTSKKVLPVFFTHSNDIFSFFIYEFTKRENYNSLRLIQQKNYTFIHDTIELDDILRIYDTAIISSEPKVPFPQANNMIRLLDLLEKLVISDLERDMITLYYDFNVRQTNYYTDAGRYLGLIDKYYVKESNKRKVMFTLTNEGQRIMQLSHKEKRLNIVRKILEHKPFRLTLERYLLKSQRPKKEEVAEILKECQIYNVKSEDTFERRASTVLNWIDWILELQHDLE